MILLGSWRSHLGLRSWCYRSRTGEGQDRKGKEQIITVWMIRLSGQQQKSIPLRPQNILNLSGHRLDKYSEAFHRDAEQSYSKLYTVVKLASGGSLLRIASLQSYVCMQTLAHTCACRRSPVRSRPRTWAGRWPGPSGLVWGPWESQRATMINTSPWIL